MLGWTPTDLRVTRGMVLSNDREERIAAQQTVRIAPKSSESHIVTEPLGTPLRVGHSTQAFGPLA